MVKGLVQYVPNKQIADDRRPSEPVFACLADVIRHTGWYGSAKECTGTYL